MNTATVRRIVRASAVYDLLATAAFAVPVTAAAALGGIGAVQHGLGLSGVVPSVGDPITILLADLLGSIVVVWSVVRLVLPAPVLGAADTVARALFCAWFGWALAHGASPVKVSTIRYYERRGVLDAPGRTAGGYREYRDEDVDRVRYLRRGQQLGFSLAELTELLHLGGTPGPMSGEVAARGNAKLRRLDEQIADLHRVRAALAELLAAQCVLPDVPCPVVTALARS